ncbi:MAG: PEGA domain-containing protein [Bacteroidales bacterium]|nr:PEGA domain-containing protein [Candidatus Liminaster caballi]
MLRSYLTALLLMFLCVNLHAQIAVESFDLDEFDLTANRSATQVLDLDGNPCALIKVETTLKGLTFDTGMLAIMKSEQHVGEIWLYVPRGVRYISIFHPDLGVLRKHDLGMSVQKAKTYILKLRAGTVETIIHEAKQKMGWLIIESEPKGATVFVNDEYVGNTPLDQYKVPYGRYTYRLEYPKYHNAAGLVEVQQPSVELNLPLQPAFGSIRVTSSEPGALVLLDNENTGLTTPCTLTEVASGTHNVSVQKPKYAPVTLRVEVSDGATAEASAMLKARFARLTLSSVEGAEIVVDGKSRGYTSYSEELMEGYYDVEVRLANHRPVTRQIQVIAGEPQEVHLEPTPIYGSLDISSSPRRAEIILDGKHIGQTPFSVEEILIGEHTVELSLDGYASEKQTVTVSERETASVTATLQNGRNVTVSAEQADDQIYIDGNLVGTHSFSGSLTFGNHTAYAMRGGKKSDAKTFSVQQGGADPVVAFSFVVNNKTQTFTVNRVSFKMVAVKGGTFQMGATPEQQDADDDEKPVHSVTLSDYCIGETEVTQALWKAVMGYNPSYNKGDKLPVEKVSWDDCQEFIRKLNMLTGKNFRLPTEAEWEYAARGGNKSKGYQYSGSNSIDAVAWYYYNSGKETHAVKTKKANELGLYDMSGNVWEWCNDWKGDYQSGSQTNPKGPASGSLHVIRGGGWLYFAKRCRVASRGRETPYNRLSYLGLRLAL